MQSHLDIYYLAIISYVPILSSLVYPIQVLAFLFIRSRNDLEILPKLLMLLHSFMSNTQKK